MRDTVTCGQPGEGHNTLKVQRTLGCRDMGATFRNRVRDDVRCVCDGDTLAVIETIDVQRQCPSLELPSLSVSYFMQ